MPKRVSIKKQSRNKRVSRKVRNSKLKSKAKSIRRSKSKSKSKSGSRSRKQKGGSDCEYLKVEGMNLPGLVIPEQFAFIDSNCNPSSQVPSSTLHPNLST